jgi:hypothetical protein
MALPLLDVVCIGGTSRYNTPDTPILQKYPRRKALET